MALLQEILIPLLAVNDTTLTVVELPLATGAAVKKGDLILVLETSKTTYDVEAPVDGYVQYLCAADRDYAVNEVVARIYSEASEAQVAPAVIAAPPAPAGSAAVASAVSGSAPVASTAAGSGPAASTAAAPLAPRRPPAPAFDNAQPDAPERFWEGETLFSRQAIQLIESSGIDKSRFAGRDLVTAADVLALQEPGKAAGRTTQSVKTAMAVDPAKAIAQRLSSAKRREIEYLADVQQAGLTSTVDVFVNTEGIFTYLGRALGYLKESLLPVILYESSRLLADYPLLNAWFTGDGVALYKEVSPGFAIDIDKGLKVLKVDRAAEKTMAEIEKDILRLSGSYLDDTLQVEDLTDITFTITDLSGEGVAFFRPLINKMNSAILGVSAIDPKLQRCILSLTFDHRVTEGKLAARFLDELRHRLESYRPADFAPHKDIACFKCYKTLKEDLGGAGFVRCVTPEGKEGFICQTCLKGF
jgi:pyruvate/2-oxoglutarate dehydrogenase complex dihydrolipoamide acyltransferase (E2) component